MCSPNVQSGDNRIRVQVVRPDVPHLVGLQHCHMRYYAVIFVLIQKNTDKDVTYIRQNDFDFVSIDLTALNNR